MTYKKKNATATSFTNRSASAASNSSSTGATAVSAIREKANETPTAANAACTSPKNSSSVSWNRHSVMNFQPPATRPLSASM